jgi:hypothetical protein
LRLVEPALTTRTFSERYSYRNASAG